MLERIPQNYARPWRMIQLAMATWRKKGEPHMLAQEWISQLGNLKGVFLKAAQLTSMIPGFLPEAQRQALSVLCTHSPAMGWPFVLRRLNKEWGENWPKRISFFEKQAAFAASLGQVHRAELLDGTRVACKVQYPGMQEALETDLHALDRLAEIYAWFYSALQTKNLRQELRARVLLELNYRQEAQHVQWFSRFFEGHSFVSVPRFYPDLSSGTLLTLEWMNGHGLKDAFHASQDVRDRLGKQIFLAWHEPFYQAGLLHGDPHMGNMLWTNDGITLLDFGCVGVFDPSFVGSLIDLYEGLVHDQKDRIAHVYEVWGFGTLNKQLVEILTLWASFLFKPFLKNQKAFFQDVACVEEGKKIALSIHKSLSKVGQINPPGCFLLMDRVAVVLGGLLLQLNPQAHWQNLLLTLFDSFSLDKCQNRQKKILHGL